MNPNRPMCLNNDYEAGSAQLRQCYSSLFQTFANLCGDEYVLQLLTKPFISFFSDDCVDILPLQQHHLSLIQGAALAPVPLIVPRFEDRDGQSMHSICSCQRDL